MLAIVSGASQQAIAAGAGKVHSRERQAKTACLSGDYSKGVSILAELFVDTNNPVYLFNQGRCYEQNVRYIEAAERFREYLRKAQTLSAEARAQVQQHIDECDAAIAKSQPRTEIISPPAMPPQPAAAPVAPPSEPPPSAPIPAAPPVMENPWQHTAKWVATGVAVASLGFGVFEHLRYYSKNKDYNKDPKCYDQGQCKDLADAADQAQILSIIGYGAAGLATGLAIWFWLTDTPHEVSANQAAIRFTCTPTLTGAVCGGRF